MKRWLLVFVLPAIVAAGLMLYPLPYFSEGPGPTEDVASMLTISDHPVYQSDGRFLLTTVSQSSHRLSPAEILIAWLDPDTVVVPDEIVLPPSGSIAEAEALAAEQMQQSQISATAVALGAAADYPNSRGTGALIAGVLEACPAFGKLRTGDLVTAIDGTTLDDARSADAAIDEVPPSEPVRFAIQTPKGSKQVSVTRAVCAGQKEPLLGIGLIDPFPFPVKINDKGIGGPSAGLMISLGLYDELTPGDLAGGRTIAGTGTISADGTVGPIGGVTEKLIAARAAGADLFLVPDGNLAEARSSADGLRLVPVSDFD
ncbi:MAG: S16 family serine protease, partial [Actinomycetota bacterium]